ncbi:MAG: creatininase family protein [candidate division Zixibacteria bacterium]|nr:creatininase family protein [candidate division Zixibacteria bacterium]
MIKWDELNWREFKKMVPSEYDCCILPVGTIEAHGFTNLGTDNNIPLGICEEITKRIKAMVAPIIPYGITRTLLRYPGSLTVSPDTFESYMKELMESIAGNGFKKLVILNGHGGNNGALKNAAYDVSVSTNMKIAVIHWWDLANEVVKEVYGQRGGHAALDETAALMAVRPDLLNREGYKDEEVYTFDSGAYVVPNPAPTIIFNEGEGYLNFDQKKAEEYFRKVCDKIVVFLEDIFARWEKI